MKRKILGESQCQDQSDLDVQLLMLLFQYLRSWALSWGMIRHLHHVWAPSFQGVRRVVTFFPVVAFDISHSTVLENLHSSVLENYKLYATLDPRAAKLSMRNSVVKSWPLLSFVFKRSCCIFFFHLTQQILAEPVWEQAPSLLPLTVLSFQQFFLFPFYIFM